MHSDLVVAFAFQGVLSHGSRRGQNTCNSDGGRGRHVEVLTFVIHVLVLSGSMLLMIAIYRALCLLS